MTIPNAEACGEPVYGRASMGSAGNGVASRVLERNEAKKSEVLSQNNGKRISFLF